MPCSWVMPPSTGIYRSKRQALHRTPKDHPDSIQRIPAVLRRLRRNIWLRKGLVSVADSEAVADKLLLEVHSEGYIERIRRFCKQGGGYVDDDTYLSPGSYVAAIYSAGGAVKACSDVLGGELRNAFVLTRPPGHHAGTEGLALNADSTGFCVFNNAALAARYLLDRGVRRVALIDLDAHHGNGTQEIFYGDPGVLYLGIHEDSGFFPYSGSVEEAGEGEGEGFTVNMPLDRGSGDGDYLVFLREIISPILDQYHPEFTLVSLGFDAHRLDPLADLNLSSSGYLRLIDALKRMAEEQCGGRLVLFLEGGYNLRTLPVLVSATTSILCGARGAPVPLPRNGVVQRQTIERLQDVKRKLSAFWSLDDSKIQTRSGRRFSDGRQARTS